MIREQRIKSDTRAAVALAAAAKEKRIARARAALEALQPGEYGDVMIHFCRACGDPDPHCQCWNDE